jgi:signal transduction histidine kinase
MLSDFLKEHKSEIISKCKKKVHSDSESKPTSALLDQGLPVFYNELISVLQRTAAATDPDIESQNAHTNNRIKEGPAAAHGRESLRLGYSISQVVHSYGAICQCITEFVESKSFNIAPREFHDLNFSLDCAIAEAVTEFEAKQTERIGKAEVEKLGFLIHEMKNSLWAVSLSYEMINKGMVGNRGATNRVLTSSLERMKKLMEGAVKELRLHGKTELAQTQFRLIDLINEVKTTSKITEESNQVNLKIEADPAIQLTADRDMVFTALLNLVNNAVKFTKERGNVWVRSKISGERVLIEVEDECGGIPDGETEILFKPFTQKGTDKTGMGLGLSLSRQIIELNKGKLTARDIPGKGCVFTIDLPK